MLKKTLCMVMAVVSLIGMFTVSAIACDKDVSDFNKIKLIKIYTLLSELSDFEERHLYRDTTIFHKKLSEHFISKMI